MKFHNHNLYNPTDLAQLYTVLGTITTEPNHSNYTQVQFKSNKNGLNEVKFYYTVAAKQVLNTVVRFPAVLLSGELKEAFEDCLILDEIDAVQEFNTDIQRSGLINASLTRSELVDNILNDLETA